MLCFVVLDTYNYLFIIEKWIFKIRIFFIIFIYYFIIFVKTFEFFIYIDIYIDIVVNEIILIQYDVLSKIYNFASFIIK